MEPSNSIVRAALKIGPHGDLERSYGKALHGINRHNVDVREAPKDNLGYTFFTRPMLNLSEGNIRNDRLLYSYLTENHSSIEAYVRNMLDHRLRFTESLMCPFADNKQAFIPILGNNLKSLTGFPDVAVDSFTSPLGSRKQQYNILDGTDELNMSLDLNAVFNNTYEDAVYHIITVWLRYMVKAFEGILSPYAEFIAMRIVDSHSRIFRLVMTEDRKFVKRIAATGPLYPDVNSVGKYFDVTDENVYNNDISTHSIKFKCMGVEYNDPILIHEFNRTVGYFNPAMKAIYEGADPLAYGLVKLPPAIEPVNAVRGYPLINDQNYNELEWYIPADPGLSTTPVGTPDIIQDEYTYV